MQHLPARPRPRTASSSKQWARTNELSSAYAALAAELTKTEIRSIGGYSLGRVIGEGTFGKVRLGVHRLTGTRVAIKQVPKSLPSYSPNDPSSPLSLLTREIHHHRRLRHPHVLSLYELIATESSIYLVTELCSGGELFDYLVESSNPTPGTGGLAPAEARRVFGQLVLGVAYLHAEGVVHRDLKLENVLLDEHVNVKIADLGFGREFEKGRWMDTRVGTLGYTAPEVLTGQRYLGEPVDIWALGVILYALLTGALPFDDDDEGVMRALILDGRYTLPTWLDPDARALVDAILAKDPLRRPSLREILAHPFFTRSSGRTPSSSSSSSSSSSDSPLPPQQKQQQPEARLAPPILAGSSGTPASPLGAAIHPVSLQTPPSPRATAESASYFPAPGAAPLSAVRAGKQRAVPSLDDDAAASAASPPPPPPSSSHPPLARTLSSASTSSSPAPSLSALPPHLSTAASPIPAAAAPGPMSLRRHPSTASIDFGPSAPGPALMQRAHSGHNGHGGGSVASLPALAAMKETGSGGGAGVKRRKSVGAASVRSARSVRRSLVPEEDFEAGGEMGPGGGGGGGVGEVVMEEESESGEEGDEDDEEERAAEGGGEPVDAPPPDAAADADPPVDYLSLLASSTSASSALLSSESDRALLALLDQLGFDRGQVEHSVRTSACDSCAAVWWMLRRKREEREPPPPAAAAAVEPAAVQEAAADEQDVTATAAEPAGEHEQQQPNRRPRTASAASTSSGGAQYVRAPTPPPLTSAATPLPQTPPRRPPTATSAAAAAAPTSPVSPSTPLNPADAEARLSYFLQQNSSASQSVPVLSYFPTIDSPGGSPSKNRPATGGSLARSKSRDQLAAPPPPPPPQMGSPSLAAPGSPSTSSSATDEAGATTSTGVGKRGRAGSVSMLARATSVIGQSLASLGSSNGSTPSEEGGSSALFVPRKGSLPSDDAKQGAPGTPSAGGTPPLPALQSSVSAPPTPQVVASAALGEAASQTAPATPPSTGSRTISLPPIQTNSVPAAEAPSQQSSASHSMNRSTATSRSARPLSVVSTASSTGNNGSAVGGSKKGLKGANLLSTFKLWFGQDPRKRKRASLGFGAAGAGPAVPSAAGGGAGIGRSQSMYVGSPLRRPPMGSRRSSNTSAQGQMTGTGPAGGGAASVSRRSSVSSARGAEYSPISGSALGMTPSRLGYHHHRRASDSSRTSMSERAAWGGYVAGADGGAGGGSRPTSLRSFSGQPGSARPGSARGRYRHSKAASSSSASSFVGTKDAVYRRPPTTTTVRRSRHGSHGRRSSDGGAARHAHSPTSVMGAAGGGGGRHHRRTRSGASSAHRSSSSSQGGGTGADSDFFDDDELAEGEEAILEEIEEDEAAADVSGEGLENDADASTAKLAARDKALRALSGDSALAASLSTAPPSAAAVVRPALLARHSSSRAGSTRSSSPASSLRQYGAHRATTFTAHKTTHLFGSPLQPRALPSSFPRPSSAAAATATSRAAPPPRAPQQPLRDVFSLKSPKDESAPTLAAPHVRGGDHEAASTPGEWVDEDDDVLAGYGGGLGQGVVPHAQAQGQADELELGAAGGAKAGMGDSPIAERVWGAAAAAAQGVGASKFEGRYAGLGAAGAAGGGGGGGHGKWARPAVVVEEEEEEEEE